MIKAKRKEYRIVGLMVVVILLLLCSFNVTYSYFTAVASINGTLNFAGLDVKFSYAVGENASAVYTVMSGNVLTVSPNAVVINRGDTFGMKVNGTAVSALCFNTTEETCNFYVRFKLDAYKQNSTDTMNYGQYFIVNYSTNPDLFTREVKTNSGQTNAVYFVKRSYTNTSSSNFRFCDSITLSESAPVEMLDGEFKLTITFLAGQSDNGAYKSIFNDGWGYYSQWK